MRGRCALIRAGKMELHHLRYFLAVADELYFARTVYRLRIVRSLLARAIKGCKRTIICPHQSQYTIDARW